MIEAGQRLSLQCHEIKDECDPRRCRAGCGCTLEDDAGVVQVEELGPGDAHVAVRPASTATRRSSPASSIEVSTPELDDVVRLEDDFGREGTSAP